MKSINYSAQNKGVCVTTIVVVEVTHGVVLAVGRDNRHYLNNSPNQLRPIASGCILPHREPNMSTIKTIATNAVAC